jgi:hypothetical protein
VAEQIIMDCNNNLTILPNDVLLGRGPLIYRHSGNAVFRDLVKAQAIHYDIDTPIEEKAWIVQRVYNIVLKSGGRFLYQDLPNSGEWKECPPRIVIDKIKHSLRDARLFQNKEERKIKINDDIKNSEIHGWDIATESPALIDSCICDLDIGSTSWNENTSSLNEMIESDEFFALCIKWLAHE